MKAYHLLCSCAMTLAMEVAYVPSPHCKAGGASLTSMISAILAMMVVWASISCESSAPTEAQSESESSMGASSSSSSIGASLSSATSSSSRGLLTPCGPGGSPASLGLRPFVTAGFGGMLDGGALKIDFCKSVASEAVCAVIGGSNVPLSFGIICDCPLPYIICISLPKNSNPCSARIACVLVCTSL